MRLTRAGRAGPYLGRCLHEDALASPRIAGWNSPGSPRVPPTGAHRLARSPTFGRCDSHGPAELALTGVAVSMKVRSLRLASRAGTVPGPPAYPLPAPTAWPGLQRLEDATHTGRQSRLLPGSLSP